jgi:hypothetical protein
VLNRYIYPAYRLSAIFTAGFAVLFSNAAVAKTATATASAAILSPATVNKIDDLNFGKIVASDAASTVSLSAAGVFRCGAGLTCLDTNRVAKFNIVGAAGQLVSIASDSDVIMSSTTGARMLAALNLSTTSMTLTAGSTPGNIFTVGGTLTVAANQAEGIYTGVFTVTVDYN